MIKEVVLENFKSYYGLHRIELDTHFNCIIGPNGSGKSNFIDAIQFVFGKHVRTMRCKKASLVISNGCEFCAVQVNFTDFTVRRSILREESKYYINEQVSTHSQVEAFLIQKNLGHKFIILQGEVEQIALMKPKTGSYEQPGLLEYIECEPKEDIYEEQGSLADLQAKLFEKTEILSISQQTVNQINGLVNLDWFVEKVYRWMFQILLYGIEIEIRQLAVVGNEDKIRELCNKQTELNELIEQLIDEFNVQKNKKNASDLQLKSAQDELQEIGAEIVKLRNQYNHDEFLSCQLQMNKSQQALQSNQNELNGVKTDLQKVLTQLPGRLAKVEQLMKSKNIAEETYRKLKNQLSIESKFLYSKKQELEEKMSPINAELRVLELKLQRQNQEFERTKVGQTTYFNQLIEAQSKGKLMESQLEGLIKDIEEHQKAIDTILEAKGKVMKYIEVSKLSEKQLVNQIQSIQIRLDTSNEVQIQENQRNTVYRSLVRAASVGLVQICGRLGDLGAIPSKYECAITVACPALDSVVVQTSEHAIQCLEYLKQQQIGRCSFLPLDRVPDGLQIRELEAPEGSKRLFDLITFQHIKYRVLFYNALRDTLVTDTIEQAQHIAFGLKKRVVTLDGKLIEQNGLMSGGPVLRRGGMSSRFMDDLNEEMKEELKAERNKCKVDLENAKEQIIFYNNGLTSIMKDEEKMVSQYKQRIVDRNMLLDQITENQNLTIELDTLLKQAHHNQELHEVAKKEIENIQGEINKMELLRGEDYIELQDLDRKLREIANQNVNAAKDQYYRLTADFESAEQEAQKLLAQHKIYEKKVIQYDNTIKEEQLKYEQLQAQIDNLQVIKKQIDDAVGILLNKEELVKENINKINQEQCLVDLEYKKIQSQIREVKLTIDELEQDKQQFNLKKGVEKKQQQEYTTKITEIQTAYLELMASLSDDKSQLTQLDSQSYFILQLNIAIQKVRGQYLERMKEQFLPNLIDHFPLSLPLELSQQYDVRQLIPQVQQVWEIYQDVAMDRVIDLNLIKLYIERSIDHDIKQIDFNKAEKDYTIQKDIYDQLFQKRRQQFEQSFQQIKSKVQDIYGQLNGGEVDLELIDSLDPFSEGIQFNLKPKNKTWKPISKLSGGEKTLASLSLMLALHFFRPTPLYILDEIDAALDLRNVALMAEYLYKIKAQFIVISLRTKMFEMATNMVGIYVKDGEPNTNVIKLQC